MCGIVAAAARRNVVPLLIEGLQRLEYRGYDSCGIATVGDECSPPLFSWTHRSRAQWHY